MFSFLRNLTDKLNSYSAASRMRTAKKLDHLREISKRRRDGVPGSTAITDEPLDESRSKKSHPSSAFNEKQAAMLERLKTGKSKIQKRVNWFVAPVAATATLIIIHTDTWPSIPVGAFLQEIGLRGEFVLVLAIGIPTLILLSVVAALTVTILERIYGGNENE